MKIINIFKLQLIVSVTCIVNVYANTDSNFLLDYFVYKNVPSVVGFSCNVIHEDVSLLKKMNKMGIRGSLYKLNNDSIVHLIQANYYKVGIFIDLRCYNSSLAALALAEASNYRLYDELHFWLLLGTNLEMATSIVDAESFSISTDFVIAIAPTSTSYNLHDVYIPYRKGNDKFIVTFLGNWNNPKGFVFQSLQTKFSRRSNLRGMVFRTAFLGSIYKPQNVSLIDYLKNPEISTVDGFSRFSYSTLSDVSQMYNFSLNISEIGNWEKNDTIGPMTLALNDNKIDISGMPILMGGSRLPMAKFVYYSWPFRSCFILRNPQPTNVKFGEIFRPYEIAVWNCTFAMLMLSSFTLFLTLKFERFYSVYMSCSNSVLVTIGTLCQQGTDLKMRQASTRLTFLFIMIFCYLMNNYYGACIVSVRLSEPIKKINDSLNELVKTGLQVASEPLLYFDYFIQEDIWETKSFYTQRWLTTPEEKRFKLPPEGMRLVLKGTHAYHSHPDVLYPFINRYFDDYQICELSEVNLAHLSYLYMAVTYNSSFVELAKIGFARVSEFGIQRRTLSRLTAPIPQCRTDLLTATSIAIHEVGGHLYILLLGIIFSGIICSIEYFVYVFNERFYSSQAHLSIGQKLMVYLCNKELGGYTV